MIQQGWSNDKRQVLTSIQAYYDYRDELIVQDDLIFQEEKLVIPAAM